MGPAPRRLGSATGHKFTGKEHATQTARAFQSPTRVRFGVSLNEPYCEGWFSVRRFWLGASAVATTCVLLFTPALNPAYATTYPTWQDVLNARNDVAAKEKAIADLQAILGGLNDAADKANQEAQRVGNIYQEAQQAYDEAAYKADQLQAQADAAKQAAEDSRIRAGQFISELARVGSVNISTSLLADSSGAKDLLSRLGFASVIASQADGIYQMAVRDQNSAQSLTDQAKVAEQLRDDLRAEAEKAFEKAQKAAMAAAAALQEQQAHEATLKAQLATLVENRIATEEEFQQGQNQGGQQGSDLPAGQISASGWAKPASGYISSGFGYRVHPIYGTVMLHAGTDIAGSCGTPIYAAKDGTVTYAGWSGGYGNFVLIAHDGGVSTAYGHIMTGHTYVTFGSKVSAGTHIADIGNTGGSTGCHLHFEVRLNGKATNPVPFMRAKGISLG